MRKSRKGIPLTRLPLVSTDCFLLSEWNFDKNAEDGMFPDKITLGSGRKAHWICSVCGNKWIMKVAARNYYTGQGCPSESCVQEKIRKTCLERYGVEKIRLIPGSEEKRKKTNLKRYGVENPFG